MPGASEARRNQGFCTLLEQAKYSETKFAHAVNRLGLEVGLELNYRQPSVSQWKQGSQPKPQVRAVIIAVLERRLGRPVTYAEAGWERPASDPGGSRRDTVESLINLGKEDMDPSRRKLLTAGLYSAALTVPAFSALVSQAHADDRDRLARPTGRIGRGEVETVRRMTDKVADILDDLGGGHARPMAAAFLVNTVAGYLRADATAAVHRDMLSAASDLTYLTGWMAMYERAHGLGQTYYLHALDLARESGDKLTYCRTLRGMSLQASHLRYGRKALEYADSAAEAAPQAGPRLVAFLRGQQAHASAMVGDHRGAVTRLNEAERALSQADSRRDAVGGYDQAAFLFHVSHVHYESRNLAASISSLRSSIRVMSPSERQGRMHARAVLAQRQFEYGHVEESCVTWGRFLDDYEVLSTARGDEHFDTLRNLIMPRTSSVVRDLRERTHEVAKRKAA
ncbi:hypothetical protein ACIQRS_06340 [Streptomyces termitum]|uniref:Regulatory protein n=1 Tax=Streptomyces termitum TaxID=67368 RepID=A0A918SX09_9ACTN|nr:hypothetical protein [Streptomyces termitum]GHA75648.1 hypothetical protein GCM10010305_17950 [Streptomyces termitum]